MRVGTDVIDIQKDTIPDLDAYETVVLLLSDLDPLKEKVLDICEWVEDGGSAMFALTLQKNTYVSLIEQKLGIISSGYENTEVDSIYFDKEFLIGGGQLIRSWIHMTPHGKWNLRKPQGFMPELEIRVEHQ